MNNTGVIIVAGGLGVRMNSSVPKQFLLLNGRPLLMTTIEAFSTTGQGARQIIVVLPKSEILRWKDLCVEYEFTEKHELVEGGKERFHSVQNGLRAMGEDVNYVAVHDGVRPYVTRTVIENTLTLAKRDGAAIPVVLITDTIREVTDKGSIQLDRNRLRAVQTPQIFQRDIIERAYKQAFTDRFTDDASVVESSGHAVSLSEGDTENIKITYKKDIK